MPCSRRMFVVEHDGEKHEIYAVSEGDAASEYAQEYNNDHCMMSGNSRISILVNGEPWEVDAEVEIEYYVYRMRTGGGSR